MTYLRASMVSNRFFGLPPLKYGWAFIGVFAIAGLALGAQFPWLTSYPESWTIPLNRWINNAMEAIVPVAQPTTRFIGWLIGFPMEGLREILTGLPWTIVAAAFITLSYKSGGRPLAVLCITAVSFMLMTGSWRPGMNTLALVGTAVPFAVLCGFLLGVLATKYPSTVRVLIPAADMMQTIPAFAYLIPVLLLFGFGSIAGLIASIIYAIPPIMRNTQLGLSSIAPEIGEAAKMSGCTSWQLFWLAELPAAARQILVGINQTTMAAFAMVIIAATIGGSDDLGWAVLTSLRKADFGQSVLSGSAIVFMAILMDRVTLGFAERSARAVRKTEDQKRRELLSWAAFLAIACWAAYNMPALYHYPQSLTFSPVEAINSAVNRLIVDYGYIADWIKQNTLYFILLPIRVGLLEAVTPYTWGFVLTPKLMIIYWMISATVILGLALYRGEAAANIAAILAWILFFGMTGMQWSTVLAVVVCAAYRSGGFALAGFALFVLLFILTNGLWDKAMMSVYLCGTAVAISFIAGSAIGLWAAHNDRVSAIIRPISSTLQTMPQFVLLIPALMLFQVGEFSALIAIILYAIIPPIIYVEHAVRAVPDDLIEAATQMGVSRLQMLLEVKLPSAWPGIMLGLNQTVMFGLAMLVITALVGTRELGQQVYLGLSSADPGMGLVAGCSIAFIAMLIDRLVQASVSSASV